MAPRFFRRSKGTLQASFGGLIRGKSPVTPDAIVKRSEKWQERVYAYADSIPEMAGAASTVSSAMNRARFIVSGPDADVAKEVTAMLSSLRAGRLAQNIWLVGDGVLAWRVEKGRVRWLDYSIKEFTAKAGEPAKATSGWSDAGKPVELESGEKAFRVYRPDPKSRHQAWSTHKAALDVLEAMYLHQRADTRIATNRLASSGILHFPGDELADVEVASDGEAEPGTRQYVASRLSKAMIASLENDDSQEAILPFLYFGTSEYVDGLKHMQLDRVDDSAAFAGRMDAYAHRYARGADITPEKVLGNEASNRWSQWKEDQNFYTYHMAPIAGLMSEGLEENFLYPTLDALGIENIYDYTIVVDASEVITKPDKTDAAIRFLQLGALKKEAAVLAAGFTKEDVDTTGEALAPRVAQAIPRLPSAIRESGSTVRGALTAATGDQELIDILQSQDADFLGEPAK